MGSTDSDMWLAMDIGGTTFLGQTQLNVIK